MRAMILLSVIGLVCFSSPGRADTLVLDGGTVHRVSAEPLVGRVLIVDGLIRAVGTDVASPEGAQTIDATGLHVYPGLFDAFSQLGLLEIGSVPATDDQSEMGAYNPHLSAVTAIHPSSEVIPVTRANGITHSVIAPRTGRGGVIAGQAGLCHLAGWTVEEMALDPSVAMVIQWPAIVTRSFDFTTFSMRETPFGEAEEEAKKKREELHDWIESARHYAQAIEASGTRVERDLKLEGLAAVLDGGQAVVVLADAQRDIEAAVEFTEKHGLRMILGGGQDAWKVKDLLADKGIPVLLGLTLSLPAEEDDAFDRPFVGAAELVEAGVKIAFASGAGGGFGPGGPHASRTIPYECAMATAHGLPQDEALKALTLYPAQIFGVGDRLGSIDPGKIANLIITDGSPLEITTEVRHLIIQGKEVSTDNRHRQLFERYRGR